jgi:hypothetical protein
MNDEVFLAREVTKSNTTRLNAFSAPEAGPAGVTDPDGIFFRSPPPASCPGPLIDIDRIDAFPRVDIVYSHIGADSTLVDALVAAGARGLVVAGVGRGGTTPSQGRALRRAVEKGVIVVTSNRTGGGRVGRPTDPETLRNVPEGRGATIGAGDLNPQKARMLLSLAIATGLKPAAIATLIASAMTISRSFATFCTRPGCPRHAGGTERAGRQPVGSRRLDRIRSDNTWTVEQQVSICEIPAPPFKEERRAAEMKRRFEALGLRNVRIDSIGNVIGERPGAGGGPVVVIAAHLDTVFPEGTESVQRQGTMPGPRDRRRLPGPRRASPWRRWAPPACAR